MPVVSITRLRLRSWRYFPGFVVYTIRANAQCRRAAGNLGIQLLRETGNIFWTSTIWDSEAALKQFMISGAHGKAMRRLMTWCDEAAVVRWSQESLAVPTWLQAYTRMQSEGRRSKVHHPSAAHERFEISPPKAR